MNARQAAARIAADILRTEAQNSFDGHKLMDSFLGDPEGFAAVIAEGEGIVKLLEQAAEEVRFPDGIDGKVIDQGKLGLFGLDWLIDRAVKVLWSSPPGWTGKQGKAIAYGQGHDGRYAVQVLFDDPMVTVREWFGLDQLRIRSISAPAVPTAEPPSDIPDLDHPESAEPSSTEPPYAFGIRGQHLMGLITEPTWLIGRQVQIDPLSPDRGSVVRGLKGTVDKIGGEQGTWRVHIVGPDTRRWIGLQDVTVMGTIAAEQPVIPDDKQEPMYLWPEGEAPQVRDGEELQILAGEMFAAAPGQFAFRVTSWRIVPADQPTSKAAAE